MSRVAILEYFTTPTATLLFVVRHGWESPALAGLAWPDGAHLTAGDLEACGDRLLIDFHGLPPDWARSSRADRYRAALALPPKIGALKRMQPVLEANLAMAPFRYTMDYWERLSDVLLPEEIRPLIDDCDLLCIVPHGPLHTLPFAALRWDADTYLGERFGICYVPGTGVLRSCRSRNRARADAAHRPARMLIAAVAAADDEDRAGLEAEALHISASFAGGIGPAVTLLRGPASNNGTTAASKREVLAHVEGRDILHFACHGVFGLDVPGGAALDSGLVLSDGTDVPRLVDVAGASPSERGRWFLTAREILGLSLHTDLVTLRACSSGRVETDPGDELFGLLRAFLYAGAPSVVASLWNVSKTSSQLLLSEFYKAWLGGPARVPKFKALQAAQAAVRAHGHTHPYHWGAFALVGDWL